MVWKSFTIHTTEEAEELVAAMLSELGFDYLEVSDKKPPEPAESGGMFGDVLPDFPPDDHLARITFYTEGDVDSSEVIRKVLAGLEELRAFTDLGSCRIEVSETRDEEWINNWKAYFHSFWIDDIFIRPTWEEPVRLEKQPSMVLKIDPGTAFGTGTHETTQLAVRALRKYLKRGDSFLDVGTGSGILGIVALKSGASLVCGTDIDPNTLPAIRDNLEQNDISEDSFRVFLGDLSTDPGLQASVGFSRYEIAAANIIAEILAGIMPRIPDHLKDGGIYITSGILADREDLVLEAASKAGLRPLETQRMGEWSSIVFQKGYYSRPICNQLPAHHACMNETGSDCR